MYQVKTEKLIHRQPNEVFQALKEGRLFMNCGASSSTLKIDFKVGGAYSIDFNNYSKQNHGEFLEIVTDKKIVFTWCQSPMPGSKPDTKVTIELSPEANGTRLTLVHDGFHNEAICNAHRGGWNAGLNDLTEEIENDKLRLVRSFNTNVEKLFSLVQDPQTFFAYMGDLSHGRVEFKVGGQYQLPTSKGEIKGEFLEIEPNKKISLSWLIGCGGPLKDSQVTLVFNKKDDGTSSFELIHTGLKSDDDKKAHRFGWEHVAERIRQQLS